ncbi:MAG: hypothetical protein HN341_19250 [Verrucomicrobia bacterium]|nr:hypothetical protein [Verrucomicrobiota bacterium]
MSLLLTGAASADLWVIDVTGIPSMDLQNDPDNVVVTTNIGAGSIITGIGWDFTIGTTGTSWRTEARSQWSTDAGTFLNVNPAFDGNSPGTNAYSSGGIIVLPVAITNINGNTTVQFHEDRDDYPGSPDAYYLTGTYTMEFTVEGATTTATLTISNASVTEGDSGTTQLVFDVVLDAAVGTGLTVDYATTDGTAEDENGDGDYQSATGTVTFAGTAGETQTVSVTVNGDSTVELDETVRVLLNNVFSWQPQCEPVRFIVARLCSTRRRHRR